MEQVIWNFPLKRPHTGMMFGNGTMGLLVWGEKNHLKITVSRADFWDHRGGMSWTKKQQFSAIRQCLEKNDAAGIKAIFACDTETVPGQPHRPSVMPVGRLDITLPESALLLEGSLNIKNGEGKISYRSNKTIRHTTIAMSMKRQLFSIELPACEKATVTRVTSAHFLREYFQQISIAMPTMIDTATVNGWIQSLPNDPALGVGYRQNGNLIMAVTERGDDLPKRLDQRLNEAEALGIDTLTRENRAWWSAYWMDVPAVEIPNEKLNFIYYYGLYKYAGFTNPDGIPATLQGPWIEEHRMPPWSSDYHFNINVQMCYWPAYKANRLSHLMPMFDLVLSWKKQLRQNARYFVGIDDGYMLPHAVDDRCTCMGSFWTGTIDHACSAWIAQMMYQYYLYTGDLDFLRHKAFDFMKGTMRVYEEMMEKHDGHYSLPVSVSPEYRGAQMDAWGANASFQLAAVHRLCQDLIAASTVLGEKPSKAWLDIDENLPAASLFGEPGKERLGLWDGTDLEESHRHHSHLAGICPFDSINHEDEEWREIINRSINHWVRQGMGQWTGWCMPWASMLHSRLHNGQMAEMILEIWHKVFTNEGHGTLHDVNFPGLSIMGAVNICPDVSKQEDKNTLPREIMQMDAGMGAVTAIQDMLLHTRRGVIHVFPGVPCTWRNASFTDMPCEGGVLISGIIANGEITEITLKATRKTSLQLGNPRGEQPVNVIYSTGKTVIADGKVLKIELTSGESCVINP